MSTHQKFQRISVNLANIGELPLVRDTANYHLGGHSVYRLFGSPKFATVGNLARNGGISSIAAKALARCLTDGDVQGVLL